MNNTDKTTQELREAIRDSLTRCAVNGLHLQRLNKEFILHETAQLLSLIAKHEAELIGEIENGLSQLYIKYPELRTAMHSVLYQERATHFPYRKGEQRMKITQEILEEFRGEYIDFDTNTVKPNVYAFNIEQFIADALAKYKAELLEEVDREVIGVDRETDPDKLGHFEVNEYMDIYEAINLEKAEQRQKLSELKGKNE